MPGEWKLKRKNELFLTAINTQLFNGETAVFNRSKIPKVNEPLFRRTAITSPLDTTTMCDSVMSSRNLAAYGLIAAANRGPESEIFY